MPTALITYSTVDGHTLSICQRIADVLERHGYLVTLIPVEEALQMDCSRFEKIVLGASIRYGKHRRTVDDFVVRNRQVLESLPNAFFSVSAVARKSGKDCPAGNPYFKKFIRRSGWTPQLAATFAGKIDYSRYGLADRLLIQLIMWITQGPTDPKTAVEFTDWAAVNAFALRICQQARP